MMLPAFTISPPNFLQPSRCPSESLPLRELPPAFLCAISVSPRENYYLLCTDLFNLENRSVLAMSAQLTCPFATLRLEHQDLLVFALSRDLGGHHCASNNRSPYRQLLATNHQHFGKFNLVTDLALKFFYLEKFTLSHFVLFSTGFNNCVHSHLHPNHF